MAASPSSGFTVLARLTGSGPGAGRSTCGQRQAAEGCFRAPVALH